MIWLKNMSVKWLEISDLMCVMLDSFVEDQEVEDSGTKLEWAAKLHLSSCKSSQPHVKFFTPWKSSFSEPFKTAWLERDKAQWQSRMNKKSKA